MDRAMTGTSSSTFESSSASCRRRAEPSCRFLGGEPAWEVGTATGRWERPLKGEARRHSCEFRMRESQAEAARALDAKPGIAAEGGRHVTTPAVDAQIERDQ